MRRHYEMVLLALLTPGILQAADPAEGLLPRGTQVYLRWDGTDAHRDARAKTATGKVLQGDLGQLLTGLLSDLNNNLPALLRPTGQKLSSEQMKAIQADAAEVPKLLRAVMRHGIVYGMELRRLSPPEVNSTVIFPSAGEPSGPFLRTMRLLATLGETKVTETKAAGRTIHYYKEQNRYSAWWIEGADAVATSGTGDPEAGVKQLLERGGGLSANPQLKQVQEFKRFETSLRLFVDVAGILNVVRASRKEASPIIDALGLDGLKSLTYNSGFDGAAERSLTELHMPGSRKGLLRLSAGKPLRLSDLPAFPPNVTSFWATHFDYGACYDVILETTEALVRLSDPQQLPKLRQALRQADATLGIDIRKELLGALGDQFVVYQSPVEGPLFLRHVFLLKVRDAAKLKQTLDRSLQALAKRTGIPIQVKKKDYHGVELCEVFVKQPGFALAPTYAMHQDWLVLSYYPQPVQSYLLRAAGKLPAWKPDERLRASLAKLPEEFTSLSLSDPRPGVELLFTWAPLIAAGIKSGLPESNFDVSSLPNIVEMTQDLFPNITVVSDDGKSYRRETVASLELPLGLDNILENYALLVLAAAAFGTDQKVMPPMPASKPIPKKAEPPFDKKKNGQSRS